MSASLLLDTNIYSALVDDPSLLDATCRAETAGRLRVFITHVQHDELAAIPAEDRRRAHQVVVELLNAEKVPTAGFVLAGDDPADPSTDRLGGKPWGSRLDEAALFTDSGVQRHAAYVDRRDGRRPKRQRDALLLDTAAARNLRFVTAEVRERNRMKRFYPEVEVLGLDGLRAMVDSAGSSLSVANHVTLSDAD